jgi:hypothetical protein
MARTVLIASAALRNISQELRKHKEIGSPEWFLKGLKQEVKLKKQELKQLVKQRKA